MVSKPAQIKLGIIGGGQLGRLLCLAAKKLNMYTIVLDPTPQSPAGQVANEQIVGSYSNPAAIKQLALRVDYLTFEIESAEASILQTLFKQGKKVNPSPFQLAFIQDKFLQKKLLADNGLPVAPFRAIHNKQDIGAAIDAWGCPLLLKARKHAFDGRGNYVINTQQDIANALKKLGQNDLYAEQFVPFKKELAIQICRTNDGAISLFPVVETIQKNNICHIVKAPAQVVPRVQTEALAYARRIGKLLQGSGVFGIEMFLTKKNEVLINELAPRVHNSGHYTIEACSVSQFEQHIRAACDLPLKRIKLLSPAVLINLLGERTGSATPKNIEKAEKIPGVSVHIYGKKDTKPERKMGHITALGTTVPRALQKAVRAKRLITI